MRLLDSFNQEYGVVFSVEPLGGSDQAVGDPRKNEISERCGKRLLVGKYVLFNDKPALVTNLSGDGWLTV